MTRLGTFAVAAVAAMATITSSAFAGPADLDPSFGANGVVIVPGGDHFDPQDAPLLRADGTASVVGLLRNPSDRAFITRFTPAGALDPTFAGDGEVHTNVLGTPSRRVSSAAFPDGRVVVAGGSSNSKAQVTLERYLPSGAGDTAFGSNGRITVTIPGSYLDVTGVLAMPDGRTLVTAYTNSGASYRSFVVLRFTDRALDATFGSGGVARVPFGTRNATAYDLALLSNGKVLAAGSVGDGDATNLATVRLNPNGTLDTAYGSSGRTEHDTTRTAKADFAMGLVADETGGFAVAGPAGTTGMVARLTSTGALEAGFGASGVQFGGFAPAGTAFRPVDVVTDRAGRLVVAGQTTAGTGTTATTRWAVSRLLRTGTTPLDGAFAKTGTIQLDACLNRSGFGPTGLAIGDTGRIVVLGACGDAGDVAAVRLFGGEAFAAPARLTVAAGAEAAGHERIPLEGIEPAAVLTALETLQAAPLKSTPLKSTPLKSTPLKSTPLKSTPLKSIPLKSTPLKSTPLKSTILLSDIPLKSIGWAELLDLEGPLQSYTLADAFAIDPVKTGEVTLDDFDLSATPLKSISVGSLLLGLRPLSALPAPSGGWCAFLADKALTCDSGVTLGSTTLFDLEAARVDLRDYFAQKLSLAPPTDLGSGETRAALANFELRIIELSRTPYGAVPASSVGQLLKCQSACTGTIAEQQAADPDFFSEADLGQLIAALPRPGGQDVTLGGVLAGIVAPSEIPFERASLRRLLDAASLREEDLQTYTTTFGIDCRQTAGLVALPSLPDDARLVPGGASLTVGGAAPRTLADAKASQGGTPAFDLAGACDRDEITTAELRFRVEPGSTLGPQDAAVTLRGAYGSTTGSATTVVDDSRDTGEDEAGARPLGTDLVTGHIASATDTDVYAFTPTEPGRITITLSNLPADYDLVAYGPRTGPSSTLLFPLKSTPLKSTPLKSTPLPDGSRLPTDDAQTDTAQDIPLKSTPLKSISINRGTADEAISFVVRRTDVGKPHSVTVTGYNGASSEKPYVLRRIDRPAPPAPECLARQSLSSGSPGEFPSSVSKSTRTIILVNQQRMAAREGAEAATRTRARLDALAAKSDGVVVPVESDGDNPTGAAYVAWDEKPCDPERANDVGERIVDVIGHVRAMGDGLPELRNIVVTGPDEDIPQFREPDYAVVSNESDYADETVLRARENSISASARESFILSDDRYADVNPNERLVVPDAALGRLIGTAGEIRAQVDAFVDNNGVVDPKDAFVAGYDFLKDSSQQQFDALKGAVPAGAASARVDDTWDAALALDRLNRPGAGFTALNAHFSHYQALPAAAFSGIGSPNLVDAKDATPAAGANVFTVGCHSGLTLSVALDAPTAAESEILGDWAEKHAAARATYVGNTGFGYGDTDAVAWSERLLRDYAVNLASKRVTVGQALMYAKQSSAAELGIADDYWNKASMEATFYGLPMWRIGSEGGTGETAVPEPLPAPDEVVRTSKKLTLEPGATAVSSERGKYWVVPGEDPLAVQNRPIQPKKTVDVTPQDGAVVHGFLPTGLVTSEFEDVDPVIARPRVDLSANEPEPFIDAPLWPADNFTVSSEATADGIKQRLTVVAGEFRRSTQRIFDRVEGRVLASNSRDFQGLTIRRVDGALIDGGFSVAVDVDDTDAVGGTVLYRTNAGVTWYRTNLAVTGARRLGGGAALPAGTEVTEAKVFVYDEAGNVSGSDNKVVGYAFREQTGQPEFPRITFSPAREGYYENSPLIGIETGPTAGTVTYQYSVDGGPLKDFTAPFRLDEPDEGEHVVRVIGSDGSVATARFAVDSQGPTLVAEPDTLPNENGWNNDDVVVRFECADAVSGVASCPDPVRVTGEGRDLSASGTATDRAGFSSTETYGGIDIDRTKPAVAGTIAQARTADGWYAAPVTVAFACTDALSGVELCPDPVKLDSEGADQTASGTARDRAGNQASTKVEDIDIDLSDPTAAIDAPTGPVLVGDLTGRAADAVSGVKRVRVVYTNRAGGTRVEREATLTCASDGRTCTWSATSPGTGVWDTVATTTDRASRTGRSETLVISVL